MSVRLDLVQIFLSPNLFSIQQGIHRRSAVAHFALMSSIIVVINQPFVQIFLEFIQVAIELFAERDLIELLQDGLVEAFANPIGLRRHGLGFGLVDVVDRQV